MQNMMAPTNLLKIVPKVPIWGYYGALFFLLLLVTRQGGGGSLPPAPPGRYATVADGLADNGSASFHLRYFWTID